MSSPATITEKSQEISMLTVTKQQNIMINPNFLGSEKKKQKNNNNNNKKKKQIILVFTAHAQERLHSFFL